jgi:hypothetical protein
MRTHDSEWTLIVVDCRLPVVGRVVVSSDRAQRTLVGFNERCAKWEVGGGKNRRRSHHTAARAPGRSTA